MNEEAKKVMEAILVKEPSTLTKEDIMFLKARRSYLTAMQRKEYANIIETKKTNKPNKSTKTETKESVKK